MTYWPDAVQELLLEAALLPGSPGVDAFTRWRALANGGHLDEGSYRLLPLLVHNLERQGVVDPFLQLCRGVHRHTWVRNQMQLTQARQLLKEFRREGIDAMLLKGPALALAYYPDCGLRPFEDIDLLVPTAQAQPAFALLGSLGWRPCQSPVSEITRDYAAAVHAVTMVNGRGLVVDLHWHLLFECLGPAADEDFWRAAERVAGEPDPLCILNPTDQLFHACMHGLKHHVGWESIPPIRWVADALTILATAGTRIDYRRLGVLARERHLVLALQLTLGYLRDRWQAPVPASLLDEMAGWPVADWERAEWRTQQNPPGVMGSLPMMWRHYLRLRQDPNRGRPMPGFAGYLQHRFNARHRRGLFLIFMRRGVLSLRRWIRASCQRRNFLSSATAIVPGHSGYNLWRGKKGYGD